MIVFKWIVEKYWKHIENLKMSNLICLLTVTKTWKSNWKIKTQQSRLIAIKDWLEWNFERKIENLGWYKSQTSFFNSFEWFFWFSGQLGPSNATHSYHVFLYSHTELCSLELSQQCSVTQHSLHMSHFEKQTQTADAAKKLASGRFFWNFELDAMRTARPSSEMMLKTWPRMGRSSFRYGWVNVSRICISVGWLETNSRFYSQSADWSTISGWLENNNTWGGIINDWWRDNDDVIQNTLKIALELLTCVATGISNIRSVFLLIRKSTI